MDLKGLQCEMGANDKLYSRPPASLMTRHDLLSLYSPAMFVPPLLFVCKNDGNTRRHVTENTRWHWKQGYA